MEDYHILFGLGEEVVGSPPKGAPGRGPFLMREATTYVDTPCMGRSLATENIPQAVVTEIVEAVRGGVEEDPFRRSSKVMRSPPEHWS